MVNSVVIGLTGPTGAGKSTVCVELAAEGCSIIDCDVLAHRVLDNSSPCKEALSKAFGQDILDDKGKIDRKLLGSRAFGTAEHTKLLNGITHPYILAAIKDEIRKRKEEKRQFIVLDAPTLLESGAGDLCDFVIVVTVPEDIRRERIMQRDCMTAEAADQRIAAQPSATFYTDKADYVIDGTQDPANLSRKVRTILKSITGGYDA